MFKPQIIGINGPIGAGKDTVASILRQLEPTSLSIACADKMKELLREAFLVPHEYLWGPSERRSQPFILEKSARCESILDCWCKDVLAVKGGVTYTAFHREVSDFLLPKVDTVVTARHLLEYLGTEIGRKYHPALWAVYTVNKAKRYRDNGMNLVTISDARFTNERELIIKAGGEVWFVDRGTVPPVDLPKLHPSIQGSWDRALATRIIDNTKDINHLFHAVESAWMKATHV